MDFLIITTIATLPLIIMFVATCITDWMRQKQTSKYYRKDEYRSDSSDQEYLNAFSWDVNAEVALKVRQMISEQLNIPVREIHPDSHFERDFKV